MNLLTTPAQIKNKLILLIEECTSMQIAVAWGTANHDVYKVHTPTTFGQPAD